MDQISKIAERLPLGSEPLLRKARAHLLSDGGIVFTPHLIERADCYAEYQARRAKQRRIEAAVAAVCTVACGAIIIALVWWAF